MPTEEIMETMNEVVMDTETAMDIPVEEAADTVMDTVTETMADMDDGGSGIGTGAKVLIGIGATVLGVFGISKAVKKVRGSGYTEVPRKGPQLMVSNDEK